MGLASLFSGNALAEVDEDGGLRLPPFVLRTLARRSEARRVLFSPHEADPCMTGYDEGHEAWLFAEAERRRLYEETLGLAASAHHARLRRTFGSVDAAEIDPDGRVVLPAMMRVRAGIDRVALVIGAGAAFEVWNPETARDAGDPELRQLAAFALAARTRPQQEEQAI
jgi:MraZ protein